MIGFNRATVIGRELDYLQDAIARAHLSGDGFYTRKCEEALQSLLGSPRVLLTTSCTSALEMAALLTKVGPGDEVVMPSFTFVSTANAFVLRGAHPRFVDIRPDTLNMDEAALPDAIGPRTKAIVPVHYAGVGCKMDDILTLARRHDLAVIEDAAQGISGSYKDRPLGTMGQLGALSFHETKNVTGGEGGALIVNDPAYAARAEILREKGTNRRAFLEGQVDKYSWVDVGSSYVPSDMLAAFLLAQLESLELVQARRKQIFEFYRTALQPLEDAGCLRLPRIPGSCRSSYHLFYLLTEDAATRTRLLERLRSLEIGATFHYVPLHSSPMGKKLGYRPGMLPVTEDLAARLVRLPLYYSLDDNDAERVVDAVRQVLRRP